MLILALHWGTLRPYLRKKELITFNMLNNPSETLWKHLDKLCKTRMKWKICCWTWWNRKWSSVHQEERQVWYWKIYIIRQKRTLKSPLINFINIKLWSHECSLKILTNFYIFLLWQQYFGVIVKLAILFWVKLWIYFIQLLSPPGQQVNDLFRLSNDFFFKARSIWREIAE